MGEVPGATPAWLSNLSALFFLPLAWPTGTSDWPGDTLGGTDAPAWNFSPLPFPLPWSGEPPGEAGAPGPAFGAFRFAVFAAPFGGMFGFGIFFGFSDLNFCTSRALVPGSVTLAQPFSSFGCSILPFTFGGAIWADALCSFMGAAKTSLSPSTLVTFPILTAWIGSILARSSLKRWIGRTEYALKVA